jgi:hypothetical protein
VIFHHRAKVISQPLAGAAPPVTAGRPERGYRVASGVVGDLAADRDSCCTLLIMWLIRSVA